MSVAEDNWDYFIDLDGIEKLLFDKFKRSFKCLDEEVTKYLENDQMKTDEYSNNPNVQQNYDEEFKLLTEKNKKLQQDIDFKLAEISKQEIKCEEFKKDEKHFIQETKDRHEAFLMGKKYYREFLKMYYTIEFENSEKQVVYVQFFTECKQESEDYSIRLEHNKELGTFHLLSITPKLSMEEDIRRVLQYTNDLPGLLCFVRQSFVSIKSPNQ